MNDTIIDPIIDSAEKSIKRAKPHQFFLITEGSYMSILTAKEFKALKPAKAELADADANMYEKITPQMIAKLTALMENPPYFENADESFARKDVEKAKAVAGITFKYRERTAVLLSDGTLNIGCQKHPLSVWASTEPSGFGSHLAQYLSHDDNAAARDALIPVLRLKLKELKAV